MRILSVDGGGYLGLATASFIEGIENHFNTRFSGRFDLFCGTSTGAIIALALAAGLSGSELVSLYKTLGTEIFGSWSWWKAKKGFVRSFVTAKYSSEGLKRALNDTFKNMTLDDLAKRKKNVLVPAFCLTTGRPRIFKTDHSDNLSLHGQYRVQDVALASASAPTYFPYAILTNPKNKTVEAFCDGGVVANHPAALGFAEAVTELNTAPSDITLLSLSTPRLNLEDPMAIHRKPSRGILGWASTLSSIFTDANTMNSEECFVRTVRGFGTSGPRYERVKLQNTHCLPMDRADDYATGLLVQCGATEASSNAVRAKLAPFFIIPVST